jgi:protein-tyrosine phosphatase
MADPYYILFICTGNICRSPMADAMLRNILPADLQPKVLVASAGTHATDGLPAEPHAVKVMSEFSVDLSGHRSRMIGPEILSGADLVLVMETLHDTELRDFVTAENSKIRLMGTFGGSAEWEEIPDPYGGDLARYRQTAMQIRSCLDGVIEHLKKELSERR